MFKEEVTQYCPMCQEWAEKYNQLKEQLEAKEQECEKLKEEVSYLQCKWRIKCLKKK